MASAEIEDKDRMTLQWRIENFSYWDRECPGEKIVSPEFLVISFPLIKGRLHLFPNGKEEGDQNLRVDLHLELKLQSIIADCDLSFLDGSGSALTTGFIRICKMEKDMPLALPACPRQEEVFHSKRSSFLPHDSLTILFRLWRSDMRLSLCRNVCARTRLDALGASILLRHGVLRTLELDQTKDCELIFQRASGDVVFFFTYSLTGSSLSDAVFGLKIQKGINNRAFRVTWKLSLLNTEGKTIRCIEEIHKLKSSFGAQVWHFPHILTRKELLDNPDIDSISIMIIEISESTIIMLGVTIMEFDFPKDHASTLSEDACIEATQQVSDQPATSPQRRGPVTILGEDLLSIYKDQTLSDFELRSGDLSFPVHKIVLSARSPVFRAMFCGDMREVDATSLDVPDVDAHALNRMLTFLYAGIVDDLQWEGAAKLYYAADKYQVLSLKEECSALLRSSIGVSNVCDILALADRHQDHELTSFVHEFFLDHLDEILISDEWVTFLRTDAHLAGITVHHVYKRKLQVSK